MVSFEHPAKVATQDSWDRAVLPIQALVRGFLSRRRVRKMRAANKTSFVLGFGSYGDGPEGVALQNRVEKAVVIVQKASGRYRAGMPWRATWAPALDRPPPLLLLAVLEGIPGASPSPRDAAGESCRPDPIHMAGAQGQGAVPEPPVTGTSRVIRYAA